MFELWTQKPLGCHLRCVPLENSGASIKNCNAFDAVFIPSCFRTWLAGTNYVTKVQQQNGFTVKSGELKQSFCARVPSPTICDFIVLCHKFRFRNFQCSHTCSKLTANPGSRKTTEQIMGGKSEFRSFSFLFSFSFFWDWRDFCCDQHVEA